MSQQLQITGGAKVRDLNDVIIGTSGVLSSLAFNVANGVPKLDVNGKILVSQLPNSVMEYQGTWDASTNTPTLVNGTGNQGDVYLCNVAGTTNFGAGPITFAVGDSAIYSGTIWQRAGGATGTVTSVGLSSTGNDAITITGSPVTTNGTINLGFAGTNLQYINGTGDLTTFPTLITSIGLSMPTAFSVSNSPLTANGTIAVTGAGYPSQYIRGDGTLADFPTSGGGGSSVSYYLNGGTSQGTIGGVTYYEMSKTADTGTGVDFPKSGDGLIVSFLTDAGDPAQLNIPAGNWNYEIYASMSSNGGTPQMYAELYVYNGTTFTLIATSSNEILYDGVNLNLYTFAMTVPATTLTLTDRLAVKLYATNSGGKTTTVHTQDSHLCQVITTFSTGITALNGLTAQVQYFATGTSGSDFNISSATATHTFNIPDASATARGLITTGTQTIAGLKTFNSGIIENGGFIALKQTGSISTLGAGYFTLNSSAVGSTESLVMALGSGFNSTLIFNNAASYSYTFPAATGTLALTSDLSSYVTLATDQSISGNKTFTGFNYFDKGVLLKQGFYSAATGYNAIGAISGGFYFGLGSTVQSLFFSTTNSYNYTFPNASGTLALTSNLSSYLPLTGGTLTGSLTAPTFIATTNTSTYININSTAVSGTNWSINSSNDGNLYLAVNGGSGYGLRISNANKVDFGSTIGNGTYTYTFPAATGTIALGTGTTNYVSKWTGTNTIGNSLIWDNGTNVGIGNTNTSYTLDVSGTVRATGYFALTTTSDAYAIQGTLSWNSARGTVLSGKTASVFDVAIYGAAGQALITNPTGTSVISFPSGNVGIGTSSPSVKLDVGGASNADSTGRFAKTGEGSLLLGGNRSTSNCPYIGSENNFDFAFITNNTERMRITSGGNVLIGTTSSLSPAGVASSHSVLALGNTQWTTAFQTNATVSPYGIVLQYNGASPNTYGSQFLYCNDTVGVKAQIWSNGGIGNYSSNNSNISDERTKKDIILLESYWDKFKAIEIVKFKYKDQTHDDYNIGVIAQQVESVAPEFINEDGFGEMFKDGIPLKSVYTTDLYHATIKVLQEAMAKIEELNERLNKAGL